MIRNAVVRLRQATGPFPDPPRRARIVDGLLALLLACYAIIAVRHHGGDMTRTIIVQPDPFGVAAQKFRSFEGPGWPDFLVALLTTLPLALRRRFPLAVFWFVIVMCAVKPDSGDATSKLIACTIVAYTAAAHSPYRPASTVSLVAALAAIAGTYGNAIPNIPRTLGVFLVFVPIVAAGASLRNLRERIAAAQERERALERDKAQASELATEQERARIARELHDVITHNVSVMVVQAGAARKIMSRSPEQATGALLAVESAGRAAMTELQHAMGLLAPDGEAQLAPQPGLAELGRLIGRVRATGMRVELTETGAPRPLAAGSDLAAYRVVQEALTNAAKHAAGASAHVRISYTPQDLVVAVANGAGRRSAAANEGNGRGLMGLRERLTACGGALEAAARADGGFEVRAVIPLHDLVEAA